LPAKCLQFIGGFFLTHEEISMEFAKPELDAVEQAVAGKVSEIKELGELELALVGGGTGDVTFG
jgi:hypothetical protein